MSDTKYRDVYFPIENITPLDEIANKLRKMKDPHKILGASALIPGCNRVSGPRVILGTNHMFQKLNLLKCEPRQCYSGYENDIGKHSSSLKRIEGDCVIEMAFEYNRTKYIQIKYNEPLYDGTKIDLLVLKSYEFVQDKTGFVYFDAFSDASIEKYVGMELKEGSVYQWTSFYDDESNFAYQYGVNLKTFYSCEFGLTYEDGIVISDVAAKKLSHYVVDEITIKLNPKTQELVQFYKSYDSEEEKFFPDVGEFVNGETYFGIRNVTKETKNMLGGKVVRSLLASDKRYTFTNPYEEREYDTFIEDIQINTNIPIDEIEDYNKQIFNYIDGQNVKVKASMFDLADRTLKENDVESFGVMLNHEIAKNIDDLENINYTNKELDNFINIKFTIKQLKPADIGSKITDAWYASKCCISSIRPRSEMPRTEDGVIADVVLNAFSVINRMNPGQLYEQGFNYISDELVKRAKTMSTKEGFKLIMGYIKRICKLQYNEYFYVFNKDERIDKFSGIPKKAVSWMKGLLAGEYDLRIMFDPLSKFNFKDFALMVKDYNIKRKKIVGKFNKGIIASKYTVLLMQEPITKFSNRNTGVDNPKGLPMKVKKPEDEHISTPVRTGTEETSNLTVNVNDGEIPHTVNFLNKKKEKVLASTEISEDERNFIINEINEQLDSMELKIDLAQMLPADNTHLPIDEMRKTTNISKLAREEYIDFGIKTGKIKLPNIDKERINDSSLPVESLEFLLNTMGLSISKDSPLFLKMDEDVVLNGIFD